MCGILLTNRIIQDLDYIIKYLKFRGPDNTSEIKLNDFSYIHTLLSMTGEGHTIQPFIDDTSQIVAMFNGEIYNYKSVIPDGSYKSDGEVIIPAYLAYGNDFIRMLDGEFAVVLCDFNKRLLYASTDTFSTKPLWISIDGKDIGVSSYKSCLKRLDFTNIVKIEANTTFKINLDTFAISRQIVTEFDLNQHKNSFNDFVRAFEKSIIKRTQDIKHGVFIGLSSGYDSGCISCALNHLGIDYTAYSIVGSEDEQIIDSRLALTKNGVKLALNKEEFMIARDYLKENSEEYSLNIDNGDMTELNKLYTELFDINEKLKNIDLNNQGPLLLKKSKITSDIKQREEIVNFRKVGQLLTDDNGAIGMSYICSRAKPLKIIYLSGSGADEICSDYGYKGVKHYGHSTIGGHFPGDLKKVFPWKNFFGNTQRAYLMKEEYVTGSYGIEGRYPFLDKDLVQEFLWLNAELKNSHYKAPLHYYMTLHNYPFILNNKVGFNCGFTGPSHLGVDSSYLKNVAKPSEVGTTTRKHLIIENINEIDNVSYENIYYIDKSKIQLVKGYCYSCELETNEFGDSVEPSPYKMYENNIELIPHIGINDIIEYGAGRYSHYSSGLIYFSSHDNSNPITNESIYKLGKGCE